MRKRSYHWLMSLSTFLHKTQQKTLLAVLSAVCLTGKLRSLQIAQTLAQSSAVSCKSALQRFYRFINASKIDTLALWAALTHRLLEGAGPMPVISVDWTYWRFDLLVLAATLSIGQRAVPVFVQTFAQAPPRSQNCREDTFLTLLVAFSPPMRPSRFAV